MSSDYSADARLFRQLVNVEEWLRGEEALGMPARHELALDTYSSGHAPIGAATVALYYLAAHRSARGLARVLGGDAKGFDEVDVACLYSATAIRLLARAWELDERPNKRARFEMGRVAACYMHAAALGCDAILKSLSRLVTEVDSGSGAVNLNERSSLSTLMAHYVLGKPPVRSGWAPLGPFSDAIVPGSPRLDYQALASLHLKQATTQSAADFHGWPGSVVPFELFAIEKRTGVTIPESAHPLLNSPFALRRTVPRIESTEELSRVMERAASELRF